VLSALKSRHLYTFIDGPNVTCPVPLKPSSGSETNKQVWDTLASKFDPGKTAKYHLVNELFHLRKANSTQLATHFNKIDELIAQMDTPEFRVPPDFKIWLILNSLPAKYNMAKSIIVTVKKADCSLVDE
jgi:hypothetical protein